MEKLFYEVEVRDQNGSLYRTINGHKYSRKSFEDHAIRAMYRLKVSDDWREDSIVTIYTTNTDKKEVDAVFKNLLTDKVISHEREHWTTKEQDEIASKFIEET